MPLSFDLGALLHDAPPGVLIACVSTAALLYIGASLRRRLEELRHLRDEHRQFKASVSQLEAREQLFGSLLRNTPGVSFRCSADENGTVLFVSDGMETMTGWPAAEFTERAKLLSEIVYPEDLDRVAAEATRAIAEDRSFRSEYRMIHRDGHLFWVWVQGRATRDAQGRPVSVDGMIFDVSERKTMEAQLQDSERLTSSLMRNMPGVSVRTLLSDSRNVVFVSDAIEKMTGWPVKDFVFGRRAICDLIHPEDHDETVAAAQQGIDANGTYSIECRMLRRDGTPFWALAHGSLVLDAMDRPRWVDSVIMDISARKAIEIALHESEQLARSLLQNVRGVSIRARADDARTLVFVSDGIEKLTGWPAAEFIATHPTLPSLSLPDDRARVHQEARAGIADSGQYTVEYRMVRRDGTVLWVMSHAVLVRDAQQRPQWIDIMIADISERKTIELDLRIAKETAEVAATSKTSFLTNMSHEIRTPMNAIIGFSEVLLGTALDPQQRRHVGTVRQSARSLLRLLNDILDTAKLEKGALELEQADFSMHDLAQHVIESLRLPAELKGIDLVLDLAPELPLFFRGDALRLQQVLTNLLGNAVKFTERGEVRLVIDGEADKLRIAVHDTGIGIEPDRLDRIFKPFSQADASMSRRFGGTGLGTTIARQIVELMGGTLDVRSTPGVGSVFTALLSLPEGRPVQVQQEVLIYDLPPLLVLVADDVPQNLELLSLALGSQNHQVVTACNGAEAIEAMLAQHFDVVLMDVQMPEVNGLEATRRMRALERERGLRHTPIVALTASVMEQDRIATQEAGMDGFAAKPVDMPALLAEIARVMGLTVSGSTAAPQVDAPMQPAAPLVRELLSIDWATGVRRWGSEQVLLAAVERFVEQHDGVAYELQSAVRAQDLERARTLAHRLRGAAGNLSLAALHACAEALEDALKSGSVGVAQSLVDSLGHALHDLSSVLHAFTEMEAMEPGTAHEPGPSFDRSQWHAWAASALLSLARGELDDDNLQSLLQAMRASGQAASAQEIERALDNFDFDQSGQLLQQLIASTSRETR